MSRLTILKRLFAHLCLCAFLAHCGSGLFFNSGHRYFLYVIFESAGTIRIFEVFNDGGIDELSTSPFINGFVAPVMGGVTSSPDGRYLFAINTTATDTQSYSIDSDTGSLTEVSTDGTYVDPLVPKVSTDGSTLFVVDGTGQTMESRPLNDGAIGSPNSTFNAAANLNDVEVHPNGDWIFANSNGTIFQIEVDGSGNLTNGGGGAAGTFATGGIVLTTNGEFIWGAETGPDRFHGFVINQTSGVLTGTPEATHTVQGGVMGEMEMSSNGFLITVEGTPGDGVGSYTVQSNGNLTDTAFDGLGTVPGDLIAHPDQPLVIYQMSGPDRLVSRVINDDGTFGTERDFNLGDIPTQMHLAKVPAYNQ